MLLKTLISFSVFALVSTTQVLQKRQGSYDIRRSGRYTIVNCGNRDAGRIVSLLDTLLTVLQPPLRDVSLVNSSPAFTTFFASANDAPFVRQILTNISTGVSLYQPERKFHQTGSPLLICATGGGQVIGKHNGLDYYYQCVLDPRKSLIAIGGTPYIVICPYYLSSPVPDSPPADSCLKVNRNNNRFRGTGLDLTNSKVWTLLDGISRYYIYATTGFSGIFATDVNHCVRLRPSQMLKNPSSYVYYVASIYGQCLDFPNFSVPRRRPLENTTVSDLAYLEDKGPSAKIPAGFATPSQGVVVDPLGG